MSSSSPKQVGDLVEITGGLYKSEEGILYEKTSKGWNVKLKNGEIILTSFPFIVALAKKGEFEDSEPWKSILQTEIVEDQGSQNPPENSGTASEEMGDRIVTLGVDEAQVSTEAIETISIEESTEVPENLAKLTTLQLRELAKQKGVAIARTKADFLRIIKEKNPGEDLERLKGKVLFDRVSELHISRLRSKEELQKLVAEEISK